MDNEQANNDNFNNDNRRLDVFNDFFSSRSNKTKPNKFVENKTSNLYVKRSAKTFNVFER